MEEWLFDHFIELLAAVVHQAQRDMAGYRVGNFPPTVAQREDARRFLEFMREEFGREFDMPARRVARRFYW